MPEEVAQDPLKLVEANGPWVYELFAVLIHSGSALGGHYYAHIKSLGDDGETRVVFGRAMPAEAGLSHAHIHQQEPLFEL